MMQIKAGWIADIEVLHPCKVYRLDKLITRFPAFLCINKRWAQNARSGRCCNDSVAAVQQWSLLTFSGFVPSRAFWCIRLKFFFPPSCSFFRHSSLSNMFSSDATAAHFSISRFTTTLTLRYTTGKKNFKKSASLVLCPTGFSAISPKEFTGSLTFSAQHSANGNHPQFSAGADTRQSSASHSCRSSISIFFVHLSKLFGTYPLRMTAVSRKSRWR